MQQMLRGAALAFILLAGWSCSDDTEAEKPVYIKLDEINVRTQYDTEGTAHHKITTAWIYANLEPIGAFELPATIPAILPEGVNDITVYPGVNLNGMQSVRAIWDAYEPIRLSLTNPASPGKVDTLHISPQQAITEYRSSYELKIVEDFDDSGLNLEPLQFSHTTIQKVSHADSTFTYTPPHSNQPENNGKAGRIVLDGNNTIAEFGSVTDYRIPASAQNLYLEVTYKTNVDISFGLVAQYPIGEERAITTTVFPKQEWSKIHIDLATELDAFPGATGYKLYILARRPTDVAEAHILLDNIKMAYRE